MSYHDHTMFVAGCFRCELGRDEAMHAIVEERDELEAEVERLRETIRRAPHAQHCELTASLFPGACFCWKGDADPADGCPLCGGELHAVEDRYEYGDGHWLVCEDCDYERRGALP